MFINFAKFPTWFQNTFRIIGIALFHFVKITVITLIIVVPIRMFVFQPFLVNGASMEPTYQTHDYILVKRLGYKLERGNVVTFKYPLDQSEIFIKRIIGLPGETVTIKNGGVFISKGRSKPEMIEEPYIGCVKTYASHEMSVTLGNDEYFVMGDNRAKSYDSRSFGPIKKESIIGTPFFEFLSSRN